MSQHRGHSVDDYLEVIYFLVQPVGEVGGDNRPIAARVADLLGISRAATGEMLKRMTDQGLIGRGPGGRELTLTEEGMERAENVVRRHRIIERFLTDFLGYTAAESHHFADDLGDTFTDDMIDRIYERLDEPDRCPHGWPVDPDAERAENESLRTLMQAAAGESGQIVRLAEHDGDLLEYFYDRGLTPGTSFDVEDVNAAAGQRDLLVGGERQTLTDKAAGNLLVKIG